MKGRSSHDLILPTALKLRAQLGSEYFFARSAELELVVFCDEPRLVLEKRLAEWLLPFERDLSVRLGTAESAGGVSPEALLDQARASSREFR